MGRGRLLAVLAIAATVVGLQAASHGAWPSAPFVAENQRQCPRLELAMLTDSTLSSEAEELRGRLSERQLLEIERQFHRRCAAETMGFACESTVTIESLDRRQTSDFVARLCRKYRRCPEAAAC